MVTMEKKVMIDIAAVQEAYENRLISDVVGILSEDNLVDAFKKVKGCGALEQSLHTVVFQLELI